MAVNDFLSFFIHNSSAVEQAVPSSISLQEHRKVLLSASLLQIIDSISGGIFADTRSSHMPIGSIVEHGVGGWLCSGGRAG